MFRTNNSLYEEIRNFIELHEEDFGVTRLRNYIRESTGLAINSILNSEGGGASQAATLDRIAEGLSSKLRHVMANYPGSGHFEALKYPRLGWLIERLLNNEDPVLDAGELAMDHVTKYLVDEYSVRLTVFPSVGRKAKVVRDGEDDHEFPFNNIATAVYNVRFSPGNQRSFPGFKLYYSTSKGKVIATEPRHGMLSDERNYRKHRLCATFEPDPGQTKAHALRVIVLGGYGPGEENAHFSMSQPALYMKSSITLDMGEYPDDAFAEPPKLHLVPVLKHPKFHCCDVARRKEGLTWPPTSAEDGTWTWDFPPQMNVMACLNWRIKEEYSSGRALPPSAALRRLLAEVDRHE